MAAMFGVSGIFNLAIHIIIIINLFVCYILLSGTVWYFYLYVILLEHHYFIYMAHYMYNPLTVLYIGQRNILNHGHPLIFQTVVYEVHSIN
jgi:hypothetical protein